MLPYTPLHHLLLAAVGAPIVLTSGNVSDEPIAYRDDDARRRLAGIADAFLTHDRPIHIRTDDSVVRPFRGRESVLRRSRGYVPEPVELRRPAPRPILACGAELKNTFCLAEDRRAFVSHHIGDLENYETLRSYTEGIEHFRRLFDVEPVVVAHDLHPEYLSTKHALRCTPSWTPSWWACSTTTRTSPRAWPTTASPDRCSGVAFDGLGLRHRRHHLGRRVPGRRPHRLRAGRPSGAGPDAGRHGGHPPAVADGRRLSRRRLRGGARGAGRAAAQRVPVGRRARGRPRPGRTRRRPPAPAGCSTPCRRCSGCATRSTTRGRPRSSSSSSPTRRSATATRSAVDGSVAGARTSCARRPRTCSPGVPTGGDRGTVPPRRGRRDRRARACGVRDTTGVGDRRAVRRRVPEPPAARRAASTG